jgi:hypothetical protein
MSRLATVAATAVSLVALGACTVNTPAPAPAPATTVVTPPPPAVSTPGTVVVPGRY